MKKYLPLFFMLLVVSYIAFTDGINEYSFIKLKKIPIGNNLGELGWDSRYYMGGGVPGPATFTISKDMKIYITYIPKIKALFF